MTTRYDEYTNALREAIAAAYRQQLTTGGKERTKWKKRGELLRNELNEAVADREREERESAARTDGYIHVDVESKRELVKVYGSPELDDTDFVPREFASSREVAHHDYKVRITDTPFEDACSYAEKHAKRLGVDWGSNA